MRAASGIDDDALSPARAVVPALSVRTLRESLGLSQSEFAHRFGLSSRTVQQWEQRRSVPEGPAQVLLRLIEDDPEHVARVVSSRRAVPAHHPQISFAVGFPVDELDAVETAFGSDDRFIEHILDRDDFRAVLMGHAYLETAVERLIQAHLTHTDDFHPASSLSFDDLISLAVALAAIHSTAAVALRSVASIRNHSARRLAARLTDDLVRKLTADVSKIPGTNLKKWTDSIQRRAGARDSDALLLTPRQIELRAAIAGLYAPFRTKTRSR